MRHCYIGPSLLVRKHAEERRGSRRRANTRISEKGQQEDLVPVATITVGSGVSKYTSEEIIQTLESE